MPLNTKRRIGLEHNESYWLLNDELFNLLNACEPVHFSTYPEYGALVDAFGAYAGVPRESVLLTPGSDAAIRLIAERAARGGKRALLPVPTFYGYERIFRQVGLPIDYLVYRQSRGRFAFPTEELIDRIASGGRNAVLFLCQPNNPLGCSVPADELTQVLDAARNAEILTIVDEAYYEFTGNTVVERLGDGNVIILRTLSKAFGLAGARVGFALGIPSFIVELAALQLPWPVAHPTAIAAHAALQHAALFSPRLEGLVRQRDAVLDELRTIPSIHTYESATNFITFGVPDAADTHARLAEQGIDVAACKNMSSHPPAVDMLRLALRMAVPSPEDTPRVIQTLREILDNPA
jgi:histidinol-phosphate aminotransferase